MKRQPYAGGTNEFLAGFSVGERSYIETTLEEYRKVMRAVSTPRSRRPEGMQDRGFSTSLFTAVAARSAGDIRYLVCVERTK